MNLILNKKHELIADIILEEKETMLHLFVENPKEGIYFYRVKPGRTITQFTQIKEGHYSAKIAVNKELAEAINPMLDIIIISGETTLYSNAVPLVVDKSLIKLCTEYIENEHIYQLQKEIAILRKEIKQLTSGLATPELPALDKALLKKGMVYGVIDGNGNCGFTFIFNDSITTINGKKAVSKEMVLSSKDIKLQGTSQTIDDAVKGVLEACQSQSKRSSAMSEVIKIMNKDLTEIKLKLNEFLEEA